MSIFYSILLFLKKKPSVIFLYYFAFNQHILYNFLCILGDIFYKEQKDWTKKGEENKREKEEKPPFLIGRRLEREFILCPAL